MDYKKLTLTAVLAMGASMVYAQNAEIADWAGFRQGAASFTFDDGAPSHVSDAGPTFKKYGYKATFNLVTTWNPDWNGFQGLADDGHEIASHSDNHGNPMGDNEIASSKSTIKGKINQKYGIITLAYPNCTVPNESQVLQNYIVGRICGAGWGKSDVMDKDGPSNWAQVPSIMTGSEGSVKSTSEFTGQMQNAINNNGWVSFLTHGFQNKANNGYANYSPTDLSAIDGALQWAQQNDKDIWVAPMGFVAMYIKERKASKIEPQDGGADGTMTFKLSHTISDDVSKYDYPLSIRVKSDWTRVEVKQDNALLESRVDGKYIYFDAVPNAGTIVVKNADAAPGSSSSEQSSSSESLGSSSSAACNNPFDPNCNSVGITDVPSVAGLAAYTSADGYIVVRGAQGMNITVFNSLGHQVRATRGLGIEQKVYTGAKGVYVIKVGNRTWKVRL